MAHLLAGPHLPEPRAVARDDWRPVSCTVNAYSIEQAELALAPIPGLLAGDKVPPTERRMTLRESKALLAANGRAPAVSVDWQGAGQ